MDPQQINPTPELIPQTISIAQEQTPKKPSRLLIYLVFILIILGLASWAGVYLKKESLQSGLTDSSKNELEFLSKIKDNWQQIKVDTVLASGYSFEKSGSINDLYKKVQEADRYEGGGPNGGPDEIQFIGKSNFIVKVYFQDGVYFSVFNYENGEFKLLETKGGGNYISEAEWQQIISKYGDPQYPFSSYATVVFRYLKSDSQAEFVYFDTLTKVPENIFIMGYWDLTKQSDTSTWKTYRNEDYGFEFKYPVSNNPYVKDLDVYSEGDFGGRLLALEIGSNDDGLHTAIASVLVTDNSETELSNSLDEKRYKKVVDKEIMIDGFLWKLEEYELLYPTHSDFARTAFYKSKNYTYSISTIYDRENFDKILSTFKFTKISTSTSVLDYSNIRAVVEKAIIKDNERTNLSKIKLLSVKIENQNNNLVTLVLDFNSSFFNEPSFTGFEGSSYETTLVYIMEDLRPIFKELYAVRNKKPALDLTENGEERDGMLIDERDY